MPPTPLQTASEINMASKYTLAQQTKTLKTLSSFSIYVTFLCSLSFFLFLLLVLCLCFLTGKTFNKEGGNTHTHTLH